MRKLTKAELIIIEVKKGIDAHNELVHSEFLARQSQLIMLRNRSFVTPVDWSVSMDLPCFLKRHFN